MPLGQCSSCGAVYAYDVTGHNLGAAFVEALVFACNNDWSLAWQLLPEEDYQQAVVEKYDLETHRIFPSGIFEGRKIRGALYFVRLQPDVQEVTQEGIKEKLQLAKPLTRTTAAKTTTTTAENTFKGAVNKKEVETLVKEYRLDLLLQAAAHDKKVLWYLNRLLCAGDELVRLRAAEAMGKVSRVVLATDPKTVVAVFQGLLKPFNDSSASVWGSIDAIGELIANAPDLFAGYLSRLIPLMNDETLRPKVVRALGRVAQVRPATIRQRLILLPFLSCLKDPNPETRGYAVWLLGNLKMPELREAIANVPGQDTEINFYAEGKFIRKTIGNLVTEALAKIA